MADRKISDFAVMSAAEADGDDTIPIVDASVPGAAANKRIGLRTIQTLLGGTNASVENAVRAEEAAGAAASHEAAASADADRAEAAAANAQSSSRLVATWMDLSGLTGSVAGEGAEVLDTDTGTHTDPVVGGTVANAGRYSWSDSPAGWRRIGETGLSAKSDKIDTDPVVAAVDTVTLPDTSGYLFAILNIAKTHISFGISKSGNIISATISALKSSISALTAGLAATNAALRASDDLLCVGDSLTEGAGSTSATFTYPRQLQTQFGNAISVTNRGIGSQTGEQIAARAGGVTTTLTVDGNSIPASGSFSCTAIAPDICYGAAVSRSVDGWIEHDTGFERVTLTRSGSTGLYTATRTTAGSALPTRAGARFIPDLTVGTPVLRRRAVILWPDRNTNITVAGSSAEAIARIEQIIATLPTGMKRYIVLDRLNNALEPVGNAAHTACVAHNLALAKRFSLFCIPIRSILIHQGLRMKGITPTAQDPIDIANDVIPSSLRADSTHLNNDGYWVVARAVYLHIQQLKEAQQWL